MLNLTYLFSASSKEFSQSALMVIQGNTLPGRWLQKIVCTQEFKLLAWREHTTNTNALTIWANKLK